MRIGAQELLDKYGSEVEVARALVQDRLSRAEEKYVNDLVSSATLQVVIATTPGLDYTAAREAMTRTCMLDHVMLNELQRACGDLAVEVSRLRTMLYQQQARLAEEIASNQRLVAATFATHLDRIDAAGYSSFLDLHSDGVLPDREAASPHPEPALVIIKELQPALRKILIPKSE